LIVVGHSDISEQNHKLLAEQRANGVSAYLSSLGIPKARIFVDTKGASQPTSDKNTPEAQAKNRRVEIELVSLKKN